MADIEHVTKWMEAAAKEVASLEKNGTWKEVSILEAKTKILPGTWVFHASDPQMEKSPSTKATVFEATLKKENLKPMPQLLLGVQFDCSLSFWIHMPRGFKSDQPSNQRTCLRLVKSLYGLSVAPRLWYQHIREALLLQGLKQSATDSCLLYSKTIMIVLYVDDLGIAYSNKKDLDKLFQDLTDLGLEFTREGTFTDFLGIKFVKDEVANTVTLTQKGLIQKIIKATGLQDCNSNHTPALQACLGIDPDGEPMDEFWNYRSIVGMLLYLSTNTGQTSHLQNYCDSTGDLSLDCYVDADFAGLHGRDPDHSDTSAKSRTGYIITLEVANPLEVSTTNRDLLSTLESEYSALSASMRTLLPLVIFLEKSARN
ncbi:hypothetical protein MHU86_11872 [Fragilaria crotonensis]|nr:hypothetical protein MHU86_11872 [Fragilaria crotonensis]